MNTVDATDLFHRSADTKQRKSSSDRESSDKESVKGESEGKNAKLGSEPKFSKVWSDNARGRNRLSERSESDRSTGNCDTDSVSQLSGKQDVSEKKETENRQEYNRSEKILSVSEPLIESGKSVKNEHGDVKRRKTMSVAEPLNVTDCGDSVMIKPDANMQNSSVMLEHARPTFPALRAILSLFTNMKAV